MPTDYAPPSIDPSKRRSLSGFIDFILTKYTQNLDDMLPARVISYNYQTNIARVKCLMDLVTTDNRRVVRGEIAAVPVLQMGGGGFTIAVPLNVGDLGWIKSNDRDISVFKTSRSQTSPPAARLHSFEDSLFIPDSMMRAVTRADEDEHNFVIQNQAGSVKISWWSNLLKIIAPRVGIGTTPDQNAILHVQSTTKAVIFPRMTTAQRDAIPSPQEGMIIWNLDTHGLNTYYLGWH